MHVTAEDRRECGEATIDKCHCEARGCCWGGDDPFFSELTEQGRYPACYYLYGGAHKVPEQFWEVPKGEKYNLRINGVSAGEAGNLRLKIVPGTSGCGLPNAERDAACAAGECPVRRPAPGSNDGLMVPALTFTKEGKYTVCMNDDSENLVKNGVDVDDFKFFTVYIGKITVYGNFADVAGDCG